MLPCEYVVYEYVNCEIMIRTRICKFMILLVCFTQGDYVMLISQKKVTMKGQFSSNLKEIMIMLYKDIISYDL